MPSQVTLSLSCWRTPPTGAPGLLLPSAGIRPSSLSLFLPQKRRRPDASTSPARLDVHSNDLTSRPTAGRENLASVTEFGAVFPLCVEIQLSVHLESHEGKIDALSFGRRPAKDHCRWSFPWAKVTSRSKSFIGRSKLRGPGERQKRGPIIHESCLLLRVP